MTKRTAARSAKPSAKKADRSAKDRLRLFKGIVFIVIAVSALTAGIYRGGEGIFFGAIFAMGFGLLGALSLGRHN